MILKIPSSNWKKLWAIASSKMQHTRLGNVWLKPLNVHAKYWVLSGKYIGFIG